MLAPHSLLALWFCSFLVGGCGGNTKKIVFATTPRSPCSALLPFLGEGSPTKIDETGTSWQHLYWRSWIPRLLKSKRTRHLLAMKPWLEHVETCHTPSLKWTCRCFLETFSRRSFQSGQQQGSKRTQHTQILPLRHERVGPRTGCLMGKI